MARLCYNYDNKHTYTHGTVYIRNSLLGATGVVTLSSFKLHAL